MIVLDFDQLLRSGTYSKIPAIVSIGVFDGLHLGHKLIIEETVRIASGRHGCKSVALTFSSNPKTMMGRNPFYKPLMSLRQSTDFFAKLGIDFLVVIDFSPDFSKLTGEAFIAKTCSIFAVKAIVVGSNFRCGSHASAGPGEIRSLLGLYAKDATVIVPDMYRLPDGTEASSTLVRKNLTTGDVVQVAALLGRNYSLDLAQIPPSIGGYSLQFPIGSFVQLLPPPGMYEAKLMKSDKSHIPVRLCVDEEFLVLTPTEEATRIVGVSNFAKGDRYDSVEIIKELP